MLNKVKSGSNMYDWCSHTWNPIRGKCPHECIYCYMKGIPVGELRLEEKTLRDNLGEGNFIFIGSSVDMFADEVPSEWILKVLEYCKKFKNKYLFQTKNPKRYFEFIKKFPKEVILGTTIETDRDYKLSDAPPVVARFYYISRLVNTMISLEPILDFDLDVMVEWIKEINPEFVSIGADSKGNKLPEPSPEKVKTLVEELRRFTEVKIKDNLKRLC